MTSRLLLLLVLLGLSSPSHGNRVRGAQRRKLLAVCEGDCDTNNDCDDNLICYHRNNGEPIPAWLKVLSVLNDKCGPITSDRHDVCIPQWLHPRPDIEFMPSLFISSMGPPLQKCWGDCDTDADCQSGLVCFQRGQGGDPVPGCRGYDLSRTDYCVEPGAQTNPPVPTTFPNEYSWDYRMDLTLGYPQGTQNRQPTENELIGARDAIFDWISDAGNAAFGDAISYRFERTEVTQVLSTSNTFLSANLRAFFSANSQNQIPEQPWYLAMLVNADGQALIQDLRIAPPNGSIFNSVNSERRDFEAITTASPPGSTVASNAECPLEKPKNNDDCAWPATRSCPYDYNCCNEPKYLTQCRDGKVFSTQVPQTCSIQC